VSFDRIGLDQRTYPVLGVPIREVLLPVRPGRNMSAIIEIAARQELLRQTGRDPAREFVDRVDSALAGHSNESGSYAAVPPATVPAPHPPRAAPSERPVRKYESGVPPSMRGEDDE
jgi:HPr kinase/phosphorylase